MAASSPTPLSLPNLVPPPLVTLPPPSSLPVPNPSATPPTLSQPNATSNTPTSSNSTSPPPQLPPPPISAPPPVSPSTPPPQLPSSPPPVVSAPPRPLPPAPPVSAPPPITVSPPPPTLSPPPPPTGISPTVSPPNSSAPATAPPRPRPPLPSPTPPAVAPTTPLASPPPPVNISPPAESPPPRLIDPPATSPRPPVQPAPVPAGSEAPPPGPNAPARPLPPPPRNPPSHFGPPPANSSSGGIPSTPLPPSPATPSSNGSKTNTSSDPAPAPGNVAFPASGGSGNRNAAVIGSIVGLVLLCVIGIGLWLFLKRKRKTAQFRGGHVIPTQIDSSQMSDSPNSKTTSSAPLVGNASGSGFSYSLSDSGGLGNSRSWFTYEELVTATNGFSERNLLGEGGFGSVYKGYLTDGREVAVKQLKVGGGQGEREFRSEVEIISRIHHRHLVSLVGYCISEHQRLLIYDYVPNDTLFYHLHGQGRPVLDWATRVKIAAGAARGLAYLHEDCHPRIIHRDIKSSNILLDNNFEAQVSDFGLAKLALDSYTHVTTRVMGTFGYLAPEYASSGKLTDKSDVYSFGVVLLELITGRKPVDASQPLGDESLVEWARPLMSEALNNGNFEGLTDPRLGMNYVESEMFQMIEAAAACVRHSAAKRPRMVQVVRALEGFTDSPDLNNGVRPGQSEMFDSAEQSAEIRMFRRMAFGTQNYSTRDFSRASWGAERDL